MGFIKMSILPFGFIFLYGSGFIFTQFGVGFVVFTKIDFSFSSLIGVFWSIVALLGLSFGSLYQKKYCSNMNLFSGGAIQTFSSTILIFIYF